MTKENTTFSFMPNCLLILRFIIHSMFIQYSPVSNALHLFQEWSCKSGQYHLD